MTASRIADLLAAGFLLLLGVGAALAGWRLGIGQLNEPGAGFLIFFAGLGLAGLAAALGIGATISTDQAAGAGLWSGHKASRHRVRCFPDLGRADARWRGIRASLWRSDSRTFDRGHIDRFPASVRTYKG